MQIVPTVVTFTTLLGAARREVSSGSAATEFVATTALILFRRMLRGERNERAYVAAIGLLAAAG